MNYKFQPGQLIDERYRLRSMIGMGGYGVVWEAWHEELHDRLAIKMINVGSMDAVTIKRVERECKIGSQLKGLISVVRVIDALRVGPYLLIIMDLMEEDLATRILKQRVSFAQALDW